MRRSYFTISGFLILLFVASAAFAQQNLTTPFPSQKASVTQRIGLTDITIDYYRPSVNDRVIWGKLVPYDQIWRAGANDNTTISFSSPVTIDGKELKAGTYGLHIIPTKNEWTVILSNNHWSWGSFRYDEKEDALRFKVKPETAEHKEYLTFEFEDSPSNQTTAVMHWEKVRLPFDIKVDVHNVVLNSMEKELENLAGFFWQGWNQIANYSLQNNVRTDEAIGWVDRSINVNRNFTNLMTKSGLLALKGDTKQAGELKNEAFSLASEAEMNNYGYQLLFGGKVDEAIVIFKKNIEDHPDSWNTYDSLGEAYATKGEKDLAIEYYTKALNMVNDENQKTRINNILVTLK